MRGASLRTAVVAVLVGDPGGRAIMDAVATKPWLQLYHGMAMTSQAEPGIKCRNAAEPIAPARRSVMLLAVVAAMTPGIANSGQPLGAASSGSVRISVSVAPKYKALTVDAVKLARALPEDLTDRFCLVTNSSVPPMPVTFEWRSATPMDDEKAGVGADEPVAIETLASAWRCSPIDGWFASDFLDASDRATGRRLLVHPE